MSLNAAFANPVLNNVAAGNVSIQQTPHSTVINQSSHKAVINWHSFNIGSNESTHFQQPAGGIVLNRISPTQGASQIYGRLTATGQVILINPAGIYFGPGAYVNVGGLIATTANMTDQDFLSGNFNFTKVPGYSGAIVNEGQIIAAQHGLVALVAPGVINNGLIQANVGKVVLASGEAFTMNFSGDNLINFAITQKTSQPGIDKDGNKLRDGVKNTGRILVDGGQILVSAKAVSGVLDHVINMEGVAQARSVSKNQQGEIIFSGDTSSGIVRIAGKVDASGKLAKQKGGKIEITGHNILLANAELDVSGDVGGGEILVGGDYQGKGVIPNANATVIDPSTFLYADALTSGDGGKVIVWANEVTKFYGKIFARGGQVSGNGGFVETSGKNYLEAMGEVMASAPHGKAGSWLLDPSNVTISAAVTLNGLFDGLVPNTFVTTANNAIANVATIIASLDLGTSVTILTTPGGAQAGNITVSSPILKSLGLTTPTLTLTAAGAILVNSNITSTSGGLNVVFNGDSATVGSAASALIDTNGGSFTSNTNNAFALGAGANTGTINTGAGTVTINANQDGAGASTFSMGAGSSITTTNTSASAVTINVNAAAGGTGTAALRDITTGNGGGISVVTNTGGNATGGNITMPSGTLNVGNTGTIILSTAQIAGRAIGTSVLNIQMLGGNLDATTGSSGLFVTNSSTGSLNLGTINTTGAFTLTSISSTSITDSGTQSVTGVLTMVAGTAQDITLDSAANNFGTATITSANNVSLLDTNALVLGTSTISGNYSITAGGTITQTGALTITGTPTFTLTGATTDLSLASQANDFATTPVITNNGNVRDLLLRNTNASAVVPTLPTGMRNVTLTFNNAAMVLPTLALTGTLTATSNGAITQTGEITGVTTGTFAAGVANNITLNNSLNNFGTISVTNGNNVSLADTNALILGALTASGTLNVTAGGALTDSGAVIVTGLTTLDTGTTNSITLNTATNNFSSVKIINANAATLVDTNALVLDGITTAGAFSVTTNGAITQTDLITAVGTTTLNAGAANDITLNNTNNNFSTVAVTTGNNVSLVDTNAVALGTSTISGTYDMTAGGNITQTGVLNMTGTPTFTVTALLSNISLASQANNFATTPVITNNGNIQDLLLRNTNAGALVPTLPAGLRNLTLTFNNAAITLPTLVLTGTLSATANGAITQTGEITGVTTATLSAGAANNITLDNVLNDFGTAAITTGNNVNLADANALILGTSTVSGTLDVLTNGAITQSGTQTISGLATFTAGTANNITLATAANNFNSIKVVSGNNISLRDTNALVIDGINANGTLQLQTNGLLSQTAAITALSTTTLIAGAANNILFTNAGNDFTNVAVTSGNNVSLTDATALVLGTSTISGTYDVIAGGTITQTGVLTVTGTPAFTVSAANSDISLASQANNFATTPVITNNGNVRDLLLRNTNAGAVVPTLATGLRNLTLIFNAAAMALPAVTLTGGLTATASGAISQTGTLAGTTLTAKTLNNAGSAITLNDTSNNFSTIDLRARNAGDTANAAGSINYSNINGFDVATIATTSTVGLIGGGAMTQSGTIVGTTLTAKTLNNAGSDITFLNANNALTAIDLSSRNATDTANVGGTLSYRDLNTLDVVSLATTGSAIVIATALTQSGAITVNSLSAKTLNNAGGAITFNHAGNTINTIDLRARNATDTANDTGAISFTNSSGFDVATIGTTSTANLTANGAITDSGNIAATTLTTSSVGGTILDFGANLTGLNATNISSGNIQLVNTGALSVTGVAQSGGGDFLLDNVGTTTINGTVDTSTGNVIMTSTGAISDGTLGAIITNNLSAKTLSNAGAAITLDNVNLHNPATINLQARNAADTANAAGAITFRDTDGFDIAAISTTSTATLTGLGAITQSGAVTGSTLTATTLNNTGAAITLSNAANDFTNINLQVRNAANTADAAADIIYRNSNGLNIAGLRTLTNANMTSGGIINDSGVLSVGDTLTTSSVGGTILNSANLVNNWNMTNTSGGAITLINTAAPLTILSFSQSGSGAVSITNTGNLVVNNGVTITSNNATIGITAADLNLNSTAALNSGSATTTITQNTALGTIGLGDATGTLTISGSELQRITAGNLNLVTPTNGTITVEGVTSGQSANVDLVTLTATAGTLGNITFQNGASSFKALIANADNGITVASGVPLTTTVGNLTLNADAGGGIGGSDSVFLNSNLTAAGSIGLSAANGQIILGAPINLIANGVTLNTAVTGAYDFSINAGSGTASINDPVSVASLSVNANIIALNGGSITTTGDQTYNALIDFGNDMTMTANNITFNNDLTGNGQNLILLGQASVDNTFTINGAVSLNNITVTGNATGNNTLAVDSGSLQNWGITGLNQGNLALSNLTGTFTFSQIKNLTGGSNGNAFVFANNASMEGLIDGNNLAATNTLNYASYALPVNVILANLFYSGETLNQSSSTITQFININKLVGSSDNNSILVLPSKQSNVTINTASNGFINDPLNYVNFKHLVSGNSNDIVNFVGAGVYNFATQVLTVNGVPMQLTGFNPRLFTGNITFVNVPIPDVPVVPPVINIPNVTTVADIITPFNQSPADLYANGALNANIDITNEVNASTLLGQLSRDYSPLQTLAKPFDLLLKGYYAKPISFGESVASQFTDQDYSQYLLAFAIFASIMLMIRLRNQPSFAKSYSVDDLMGNSFAQGNHIPTFSFKLRTALNDVVGFTELMYQGAAGNISNQQKEMLEIILGESNAIMENLRKIETESEDVIFTHHDFKKMSFDLRTSLNNIIGFSQLMLNDQPNISVEQKMFLENILTDSNNVLGLLVSYSPAMVNA